MAVFLSLALLFAACGGGGGADDSDDGDGTPFEGIGDAASDVQLLNAGPLTVTADPGNTWVETDGDRLEFSRAGSEELDCVVADGNLSVIYRNEDGSEVRLSGLSLPDGWNLSLSVNTGQETVLNGASLRGGTLGIEGSSLSYEGVVDSAESQVDVVLAANCNP